MPPRPSKSPAKRSASPKPKSPAPAKSPAADKATPTAAPKVTPKSAKAAKAAKSEAEAATPAAAPPVAKSPAASAPAKPPAAASKPKVPESALAVGLFGVLLGLLFVLLNYVNTSPEPIGWISANSFDGKTLKQTGSSAVVMFMDDSKKCDLCAKLKQEISEPSFLKMAASYSKQKKLKFGKVKCWKNEELCRRFGVAGDSPKAIGYPHVVHFQGGVEVRPRPSACARRGPTRAPWHARGCFRHVGPPATAPVAARDARPEPAVARPSPCAAPRVDQQVGTVKARTAAEFKDWIAAQDKAGKL